MKELGAGRDLLPIDDANSLAARVTQAVQELQLEGEAVSVFNVQLPASGHGLQAQSAIEALRAALADLPD